VHLALTKICSSDAVAPGELRQFNVSDVEILVVNFDGRLLCLAARCTHAGAPLVEGELSGDILTCPWHGSRFRVTDGSVVRGPAEKALKTYDCQLQAGDLFVEV
jgi:nitrite reductase/ring-hydroxylating ferredoxin subunit